MRILGIESSCDETAAAIVEDGRRILSNVIASQADEHKLYGGVVPELASRRHCENILPVVKNALSDANMTIDDVDGIAVTYAPGLIGALLVGVSFAKGLAMMANKPLIPVHHTEGHAAANYLVHPDLKPPYLALIETHKKAVNDTYLQGDSFCGGTQGADAFALDCGLGSENTRSALVERYRALGEFDTGIFGTPILLRTLFENGQEDLAYQLLSNRKDGSFDAMRRAGATTLWENWNGEASHNHPMFGASTVCLFRYILGIRQADGASGMRDLVISPVFPNGLEFAQGSVSTPQGKIAVQWERQPEGIRIQIRLCDGIQAVFRAYGQERTLYAGENILMIR